MKHVDFQNKNLFGSTMFFLSYAYLITIVH